MFDLVTLAWKSLKARKATAILTIICIAFSVFLLLAVEHIRVQARQSFANTVSGTDLIVGARSGSVQLLLYSVFRIGNPTNNISWESYQELSSNEVVDWSIPISLGDSHRGYRVMGTTQDYFKRYRYANKKPLKFVAGEAFADVYDAVLGSEVARKLHYKLGDSITIAHGAGKVSFVEHGDKPFRITGVLAPTGTPVDKTIHVSLEGIEAIHIDWKGGGRIPGMTISAEQARKFDLTPNNITAFLLGLKSRIATFRLQRQINEYREEPLLAIIPGVALQELWDLMGVAEKALLLVSVLVVVVGLIGMLVMILSGLNERRREMAILRSVGAKPRHIFGLMLSEAGLLALLGVFAGVLLFYFGMLFGAAYFADEFGLNLALRALSVYEIGILVFIVLAAMVLGLIPAYRVYKASVSDGITIKV